MQLRGSGVSGCLQRGGMLLIVHILERNQPGIVEGNFHFQRIAVRVGDETLQVQRIGTGLGQALPGGVVNLQRDCCGNGRRNDDRRAVLDRQGYAGRVLIQAVAFRMEHKLVLAAFVHAEVLQRHRFLEAVFTGAQHDERGGFRNLFPGLHQIHGRLDSLCI